MTKGLSVSIYRNAEFGPCANGGMSEHFSKGILTGPGIDGVFEPSDSAPEIQLLPANIGNGYKAVPAKHGGGVGPMFGGCFIYSSDGRFPSDQPIALHDRWESQSLYDTMSR